MITAYAKTYNDAKLRLEKEGYVDQKDGFFLKDCAILDVATIVMLEDSSQVMIVWFERNQIGY